ncbi:hypothetical protein FRC09_016533, partial [Ceratobasidium sp. 395]
MKQQLAKEAMSTVQIVARNRVCRRRLIEEGAWSRLVQTLKDKQMTKDKQVTKDVLRVLALLAEDDSLPFSTEDVGMLAEHMNDHPEASIALARIATLDDVKENLLAAGVITQAVDLLSNKDIQQVKAVAKLIKSLLDHNLFKDIPQLPFISTLKKQLQSNSRETTEEALSIILHLAPSGSGWATEDMVEDLAQFAESDNKKSTIITAWITLYTGKHQDKTMQAIPRLVSMLSEKEDEIVVGALIVLTAMLKQDHQKVSLFYFAATTSRDGEKLGTWGGRVKITSKAFEMIEELAVDSTDREDLVDSGIIKIIITLTDGPVSYLLDQKATETLNRLKAYDDLKLVIPGDANTTDDPHPEENSGGDNGNDM